MYSEEMEVQLEKDRRSIWKHSKDNRQLLSTWNAYERKSLLFQYSALCHFRPSNAGEASLFHRGKNSPTRFTQLGNNLNHGWYRLWAVWIDKADVVLQKTLSSSYVEPEHLEQGVVSFSKGPGYGEASIVEDPLSLSSPLPLLLPLSQISNPALSSLNSCHKNIESNIQAKRILTIQNWSCALSPTKQILVWSHTRSASLFAFPHQTQTF